MNWKARLAAMALGMSVAGMAWAQTPPEETGTGGAAGDVGGYGNQPPASGAAKAKKTMQEPKAPGAPELEKDWGTGSQPPLEVPGVGTGNYNDIPAPPPALPPSPGNQGTGTQPPAATPPGTGMHPPADTPPGTPGAGGDMPMEPTKPSNSDVPGPTGTATPGQYGTGTGGGMGEEPAPPPANPAAKGGKVGKADAGK